METGHGGAMETGHGGTMKMLAMLSLMWLKVDCQSRPILSTTSDGNHEIKDPTPSTLAQQ